MKTLLMKFALCLVAVFAPVKAVILTTFVLVLADLIFGILAARKRGELITSAGFRRTVTKLFVYQAAVIFGFLAETYLTGPLVPISKIVSSFIGVTEIKSILENLNDIAGGSLLKSLIDKLGSDNAK